MGKSKKITVICHLSSLTLCKNCTHFTKILIISELPNVVFQYLGQSEQPAVFHCIFALVKSSKTKRASRTNLGGISKAPKGNLELRIWNLELVALRAMLNDE